MLLNCEGTRNRERTRGTGKYEKWNETERWVMKSLIELGFKIGFVPRIPIPHPKPLSSRLFIVYSFFKFTLNAVLQFNFVFNQVISALRLTRKYKLQSN